MLHTKSAAQLRAQRLKSNLDFKLGVRPLNIHEESVLNKLTEKGPAWTIMALAILRLKDASTMTRVLVGAGGVGALLKLIGAF